MSFAALCAALLLGPQAPPQVEMTRLPPDAFAGFETVHLRNGLKLWYKRLSDEPVVSISVALPFGSDRDPPGKEQLAHFTEHMLFSDQPGRSEQEIKREIEELGGVYNASVTPDRTFYFVHIGKEHAGFAIEWLYRILAPHAMRAEVVERQRGPVALEVRARRRQLFDWVWALYLNPAWLRMPGFWEREFGIVTLASRDYYPYASLSAIASDDLRRFYETYYVPSLMTLTVVGDAERDVVLDKLQETFAALPPRPAPDDANALEDPHRYRQSVLWAYRSNVYYDNRFKFYGLDADQEAMLIFVSRLLGKRLNDRLRFGERKATYGLRVGITKRERAAYLYIRGGIDESELEFARGVVEQELAGLRDDTIGESEFEADRAAVARQLRVTNSSPEDLEGWVRGFFYDRRVHRDFPDLVATFDSVTLSDVQQFVRQHLVRERQVLSTVRPYPIPQAILVLIIAAVIWLAVRLTARWLTRPVDMTRIRYVTRFRVPRLYLFLTTLLLLLLVAVAGRLLIYGFEVAADRWLLSLDSFTLQWSAYALMLAAVVVSLLLVLAHLPRKLLIFDDRLIVKYLSYRSVAIPVDQVSELSLERFRRVWLSRRLWRCVPLAVGMLAPAVYLRSRTGRAFYFNVRDKTELLRVLEDILPPTRRIGTLGSDS